MRSSVARPPTSAVMARTSACPCRRASSSPPRPAARSWRAAGLTASTTSSAIGWRAIEAAVGRRFGDAADPLLVSVRSGAPVSMPGMMDTILNLGLNDATRAGLAVSAARAFAEAVASVDAMFRQIVGADVPDDPWPQLRLAIEAVFRSWNGDRARAYRAKEGIAGRPRHGGRRAGHGLRKPGPGLGDRRAVHAQPGDRRADLYGDVLFDAQGEDVVAGTHATEPIAVLDERMPAVAARAARPRRPARAPLRRPVRHRVHDRGGPAVAAPGPRRQAQPAGRAPDRGRHGGGRRRSRCRGREAVGARRRRCWRTRRVRATSRSSTCARSITGLPASPGIASGEIATSPEAAVEAAAAGHAGHPRPRGDLARRRPRHGPGGRAS